MKKEIKEHCHSESGILAPKVDLSKCEGKGDCVRECPYEVFELLTISPDDWTKLSFTGKLKTMFKKEKAYITNPDLCHGCGICVQVCPEKAISLVRISAERI